MIARERLPIDHDGDMQWRNGAIADRRVVRAAAGAFGAVVTEVDVVAIFDQSRLQEEDNAAALTEDILSTMAMIGRAIGSRVVGRVGQDGKEIVRAA